MADIAIEVRNRVPCMIDMDGVRPAMPGHTRCVILDEAERDELIAEIGRLRTAVEIARNAFLNIERRSEEARASISKMLREAYS